MSIAKTFKRYALLVTDFATLPVRALWHDVKTGITEREWNRLILNSFCSVGIPLGIGLIPHPWAIPIAVGSLYLFSLDTMIDNRKNFERFPLTKKHCLG